MLVLLLHHFRLTFFTLSFVSLCDKWCSFLLQDNIVVPTSSINDIQSLLLSVMCNVAGIFICKKSSGLVIADETEKNCFIEAAIALCKLQHLNVTVPVKTQVSYVMFLFS